MSKYFSDVEGTNPIIKVKYTGLDKFQNSKYYVGFKLKDKDEYPETWDCSVSSSASWLDVQLYPIQTTDDKTPTNYGRILQYKIKSHNNTNDTREAYIYVWKRGTKREDYSIKVEQDAELMSI